VTKPEKTGLIAHVSKFDLIIHHEHNGALHLKQATLKWSAFAGCFPEGNSYKESWVQMEAAQLTVVE